MTNPLQCNKSDPFCTDSGRGVLYTGTLSTVCICASPQQFRWGCSPASPSGLRPWQKTRNKQWTRTLSVESRIPALPGDLPKLSFGIEKPKNVEVIGGGEELLKSCLTDSSTWSKDPLMFRLAHTHATEIQSCRENSSPSMHVIFRKRPDEPLQTWIHLDGHGSQTSGSRVAHFRRVRLPQDHASDQRQDRMFENLQRQFSSSLQATSRSGNSVYRPRTIHAVHLQNSNPVQPYATSVISSASNCSVRAMCGAEVRTDLRTI